MLNCRELLIYHTQHKFCSNKIIKIYMKIANIILLVLIFFSTESIAMPGLPSLDDIGKAVEESNIPQLEDYKDVVNEVEQKTLEVKDDIAAEIPEVNTEQRINDLTPNLEASIETPEFEPIEPTITSSDEIVAPEIPSFAETPNLEIPDFPTESNEISANDSVNDNNMAPEIEMPSFDSTETSEKTDIVTPVEEIVEVPSPKPQKEYNDSDIVIYNVNEEADKKVQITEDVTPKNTSNENTSSEFDSEFPEIPALEFPTFTGNESKKRVIEINPDTKEEKADSVLGSLFSDSETEEEDIILETDEKIVEVEDSPVVRPISSLKSKIKNITLGSGSSTSSSNSNTTKTADSIVKHSPITYSEKQLTDLMVFSAMIGDVKSVASLVHSGRNINSRNKFGQTALMASVFNSNHEITELLLSEGASPTIRDIDRNTALHIASSRNNAFAVQQLIKYGAKIDAQNNNGDTPLLLATNRNALQIIKMLIKNGADVDKANNKGVTPLKVSQYYNNSSLEQLLISVGAKDGYNPFAKTTKISEIITQRSPQVSESSKSISDRQLSMFPKSLIAKEAINNRSKQKQSSWWAENSEPVSDIQVTKIQKPTSFSGSELPPISNISSSKASNKKPKSFVYKDLSTNKLSPLPKNNGSVLVKKLEESSTSTATAGKKSYTASAPISLRKSKINQPSVTSNLINEEPRYVNNVKKNTAPIVTRFSSNSVLPSSQKVGPKTNFDRKIPEIKVAPMKKFSSKSESRDIWNSRLTKWVKAGLMVDQMNPNQKQTWQGQQKTLQEHYGAFFNSEVDKVINAISR